MDFTKFTYTKSYKGGHRLYFDFDLRDLTKHGKSTFDAYRSLIHFLENNSEKEIFITLSQTEDFFEDGEKLAINLEKYQTFCSSIGKNGKNRAQAFFARRIAHYSEDQQKEIIAQSSDRDILGWIESLPADRKKEFSIKISQLENIELQKTSISTTDFSNILADALTHPEKLQVLSENYSNIQVQLLEKYKEFLERMIKDVETEKANGVKTDSWETFIQRWVDAKIDEQGVELKNDGVQRAKESRSRCLIFGLEFIDHKREVLDSGQRMDVLTRINSNIGSKEYILFELKSPKAEIFEDEETELKISKRLSRAIPQVLDYKSDFETKEEGDKDLDRKGLTAGKVVKCIIVIGVTKDNERWKKVFRSLKLNFSSQIEIWTYSDLIQKLDSIIRNLKENLK
jgi:hypothetical protein